MTEIIFQGLLILVFFVSGASLEANTCSCQPPATVKEQLSQNDAVVIGRVLTIRQVSRKHGQQEHLIEFGIERSWKGPRNGHINVTTGSLGTINDCGVAFQLGATYLLMAQGKKGKLTTSTCNGTKDIGAAANQMRELDQIH